MSEIMPLVEWMNLLDALKTVIERYGLKAVKEAIDYLLVMGE